MLQNNLDPEVAERPDDLVVYGGTGRAARSWDAFDAMCRTLTTLADDETMLVQSGKPVGRLRTHEWAPTGPAGQLQPRARVGHWDEFRRLEALGLTMYGQMTAGSWIYIGTQGILQGTYECFAAIARKRFGGSLAGTLTVTAGLGGMGGAQPLAVTINGGVGAVRRRRPGPASSGASRPATSTRSPTPSTDAVARCAGQGERAGGVDRPGRQRRRAAAPLLAMDFDADIVTDQTSRPRSAELHPRRPVPGSRRGAGAATDPGEYVRRARAIIVDHVEAMVAFHGPTAPRSSTTATACAPRPARRVRRGPSSTPASVPAYIRPLFCEGQGPFRWVALSGDPADIAATDRAVLDEFPDNEALARWIRMAGERVAFQGLPARICWLGYGERDRAGPRFNEMVASGRRRRRS